MICLLKKLQPKIILQFKLMRKQILSPFLNKHYLLGCIYLDARYNGRGRASGAGLHINVEGDCRGRVRFHPVRATHVHGICSSGA